MPAVRRLCVMLLRPGRLADKAHRAAEYPDLADVGHRVAYCAHIDVAGRAPGVLEPFLACARASEVVFGGAVQCGQSHRTNLLNPADHLSDVRQPDVLLLGIKVHTELKLIGNCFWSAGKKGADQGLRGEPRTYEQ